MRSISIWVIVILTTSFIPGPTLQKVVNVNKVVYYSAIDDLEFSEENLMIVIKRMGIRFADIVLAQAKLETGNFTSKSFTIHNNLFGMKIPKSRLTVATGERFGHASYEHWTYSVMDYALFQSTFARKIRTRKGYMRYLSRNYAEDENYINKIGKLL
jgi:uncharacterized FlgJ-related protein